METKVTTYKAIADGEMFKKGDIVTIDWNAYDTERCENVTQGFVFSPIGKDIKLLEKVDIVVGARTL